LAVQPQHLPEVARSGPWSKAASHVNLLAIKKLMNKLLFQPSIRKQIKYQTFFKNTTFSSSLEFLRHLPALGELLETPTSNALAQ